MARDPQAARGVGPVISGSSFVGRERDVERVVSALTAGPALVLVEGEAGVGKTRFVGECLASPALRERSVLVASSPPLPQPFPLVGLVDGVRRLCERVDEMELSPLAGALRPLFPEWADDLPPAPEPLEDAKAVQHRVFRALLELLVQLGIEVLVVEDAHWADTATLELLLVLTASGGGMSVVVTYRPDGPARSRLLSLTARPPAQRARVRVELEPLGPEEVRRLVASMFAGVDVSEEFASFLHERTEGLPLAVEESVLLLHDRRDIVRRGGEWARRALAEMRVPPTVRDSVLERVQHLPPAARRVLEAAAVVAEPADRELLFAVSGLNGPSLRAGLDRALASGLLTEISSGQFAFRHVLAAKAVEAAIPLSDRRLLHGRVAQAIEATTRPSVVRLARHSREADDAERWSRYGEASADVALAAGDHHTAVTILLHLLEADSQPVARRAELARKLGEATVRRAIPLGDLEGRACGALRDVIASGLPATDRGEARLLLGELLFQLREFAGGRAELEAAIPELATQPASAGRAMLLLASRPEIGIAQRLKLSGEVAELFQLVPPADRLLLNIDRAHLLLNLGEEAGWLVAREIPSWGSTPLERRRIARSTLNVALRAISWGRYRDAREHLSVARELALDSGFERMHDFLTYADAMLDWYAGDWSGLAETIRRLQDSEEMDPGVRQAVWELQGVTELARGNRETAEDCLRHILTRANLTVNELAAAGLARLKIADGDVEAALDVTTPAMERLAARGVWLVSDIVQVHVSALVGAERISAAKDVVEEIELWLRGRIAPAPKAALSTALAAVLLGEGDVRGAAGAFADAAVAWAALPRPYDESLALERAGACLLALEERQLGLESLASAQQRLTRLGAAWDADRVAQLLRREGVDVARPWRGGRRGYGDRLSPRELEVVRLVARGLTNREAAAQLFLSPRTIDRHISSAMHKLGVSSRTAVAVAANEAGWLDQEGEDQGS